MAHDSHADLIRDLIEHPASCNCWRCTRKRLYPNERLKEPRLEICPNPLCRRKSLFWNQSTLLYECFNPLCKRRFTEEEFKKITEQGYPAVFSPTPPVIPIPTPQPTPASKPTKMDEPITASKYKARILNVTLGLVFLFFGAVTPFIWPVYFVLAIPFIPIPYVGNLFLCIMGIAGIYFGIRGEVDT